MKNSVFNPLSLLVLGSVLIIIAPALRAQDIPRAGHSPSMAHLGESPLQAIPDTPAMAGPVSESLSALQVTVRARTQQVAGDAGLIAQVDIVNPGVQSLTLGNLLPALRVDLRNDQGEIIALPEALPVPPPASAAPTGGSKLSIPNPQSSKPNSPKPNSPKPAPAKPHRSTVAPLRPRPTPARPAPAAKGTAPAAPLVPVTPFKLLSVTLNGQTVAASELAMATTTLPPQSRLSIRFAIQRALLPVAPLPATGDAPPDRPKINPKTILSGVPLPPGLYTIEPVIALIEMKTPAPDGNDANSSNAANGNAANGNAAGGGMVFLGPALDAAQRLKVGYGVPLPLPLPPPVAPVDEPVESNNE